MSIGVGVIQVGFLGLNSMPLSIRKELVYCCCTTGKVADKNQDFLRQMNQHFQGTVYRDKGYLSAISEELNQKGMKIICKERKTGNKKSK